ncbi:MAG: restriction endonuclease subunit S [Dehalococcoidales bacterium]|nr:restriction endonuclease subunit S [Dehalococcoidales bacterium]
MSSCPLALPTLWSEKNFDDVCHVDLENLPENTDPDYVFKYISLSDVNHGTISQNIQTLVFKNAPSRARRILHDNDVLLATVRPNLQGFAMLGEVIKDYIGSTGFAVLTKKNGNSTEYIYHYLYSDHASRQINNLVAGSNYPAISSTDVKSLKILIPDVKSEQRKIARILCTVDAVIEKTEAAIAKYKAIKQCMMQDLFTRGLDKNGKLRLRYQDAPDLYKKTELGWVPKEWDLITIRDSQVDVIDGDRGENYPHENELLEDGYCVFLSANNVTKSGFVFKNVQFITQKKDNLMGTGKLARNDVVITTRGTVGNIAYFNELVPFTNMRINSGMLILRNMDAKLLHEFLFQSLINYVFELEFKNIVSGSAQPQLPMRDLKSFHIIRPEIGEQNSMLTICRSILAKIDRESSYLEKIRNLKIALMSVLLTGKVRVKYEEEPIKAME